MKSPHLVRAPEIVTEPAQIEGARGLLDDISEATESARRGRIDLPSGRVVEARADAEGERLTVRAATGEVELEVRMTERGPVLRFRAADLELESAGDVRVACGSLRVHARGAMELTGRSAKIEAERGDVELTANDDVKLLGERIKLNC